MDLIRLIESLSNGLAYPFPAAGVEVRQTHVSVVFIAGDFVYKVKKPVNLGFLDFTTLEKRRFYCEEEVRLNRRLAPTTYLDVVPITSSASGIRMEGSGELVEWAVKMERLPDRASLLGCLGRGEVDSSILTAVAWRIAAFHRLAESGPHVSKYGRFEVVARNASENFEQTAGQVGTTISRSCFDRLRAVTEETLAGLRSLIESRAARGVPRETHGDLHLDHVYHFPDRPPPSDLIVIDCIEFNEKFRFADPVADAAFLAMDLCFHGRRDLAELFTREYLLAAKDSDGAALFPFYVAYRAMVRGKVEGLKLIEKEIPYKERSAALARAKGYWLLALGELESPARRPGMVLLGGLPGTGKSTLAQGLAEKGQFTVIRSDVVRKELAGISSATSARGNFNEGIYAPDWTARTYAECLRQGEAALFEGGRVIVDASFGAENHRREFLDLAARLRVPVAFLLCRTTPELARERIASRRGDASDADLTTYERLVESWHEPSPETQQALREIPSDGTPEASLASATECLRQSRLHT